MNNDTEFQPLFPFFGGWSQTVAAHFFPQLPSLSPTAIERVSVSDGDELVVWENRPRGWQENGRLTIIVHGLTGSCLSSDSVRLCRKLWHHGHFVVRVNLRGCGPGFGLARKPYNAGRSLDLRAVVQRVTEKYPAARIGIVGFSLGGNITLKFAGEEGDRLDRRIAGVVAVSAPVDLTASSVRLSLPKNRLFNEYFVRRLKRIVARHHAHFPELPPLDLPAKLDLRMFDELYTAPRSDFRDAREYYEKSSALPLIPAIRTRMLLVGAEDDPVVATDAYRRISKTDGHQVVLTRHGGHVGFLGFSQNSPGIRWMDSLVVDWLGSL